MGILVEFPTEEEDLRRKHRCASQQCRDAEARLWAARHAFPPICADIKLWEGLRVGYGAAATVAAGTAWLAEKTLTNAAKIIGIPVAVVLACAAVALLVLFAALLIMAINAHVEASAARDRRRAAEREFAEAAAAARATCDPDCDIGDTEMPSC